MQKESKQNICVFVALWFSARTWGRLIDGKVGALKSDWPEIQYMFAISILYKLQTRNDYCEKNKEDFFPCRMSAVAMCLLPLKLPRWARQSAFIMTGRKLSLLAKINM